MKEMTMNKRPVAFSGTCRLIISDVDFTFLTDDKQVPPDNLLAIQEAAAKGIPFAFATGRSWAAIERFASMAHLTVPQVVNNGTALVRPPDGERLCFFPFETRLVEFVYGEYLRRGFCPVIYQGNCRMAEWEDEVTQRALTKNDEPFIVVSKQKIHSVMEEGAEKMAIISYERAEELAQATADISREAASIGLPFDYAFAERGIMVLSGREATKLKGIKRLCQIQGCSLADVLTIGDGDNDAEMLANTGLGIAVANGTPMARDSACRVTTRTNNDAGLAEAIRSVL